MATVWAVNNGNWSNAATWSGSYIPQSGDDVFANNRTVNVDVSFDVASLRNTSAAGVTAGGTFNFNSGSISGSLTGATPILAGANNVITVSHNTNTVTLTTTNNIDAASFFTHIAITATSNIVITSPKISLGSLIGGSVINKTGPGTLTINGNVEASASNPDGSLITITNTTGDLIINGYVRGPQIVRSLIYPTYTINQTGGTLIVNGNVIPPNQATATGGTTILYRGTSIIVNGNLTSGVGFNIDTTAPITVNGDVYGNTGYYGIVATSNVTVSGSCIASVSFPAIINASTTATNIFTGPFINTNDTMAVQCVDMNLTTDASTSWNFGNITLFSPERLAFYPSASDIRQGTTYADGTVSGSLAMPPPSAVIAGTPTDNTTGSAVLTPTQLQDAVWGRDLSQMTETGSIGNRLARVSTTGTTGAQIASYLL
jgi:hypothetical protein